MPLTIGLTGLAGSGKSTVAHHLAVHHDFARVRFSGPLKAMTRALDFTDDEIEGHLKEAPSFQLMHGNFANLFDRIPDAFAAIGIRSIRGRNGHDRSPLLNNRELGFAVCAFLGTLTQVIAAGEKDGGATPRLLMQMIGTEFGRMQIGPNVWVDLWRETAHQHDNVVAEDCRFDNEAAAIRTNRGIIINVQRPGNQLNVGGHASEQLRIEPDYLLMNDGSIEQLQTRVDGILDMLSADTKLAA